MSYNKDKIHIACFDIGKINFSFYIEEIDIKTLLENKNISKFKRYNNDGTPTEEFSNLLERIYSNGNKVLLKNINITKGTDKTKYFDFELTYNMVDVLDEYIDYWDNVDYFIVERQMSFGRKTNTMALKLAQHCESYFINKYKREKKIIEFEAYHKTQILGAQKQISTSKTGKITYKNIGDKERKKWTVEHAFYILSCRNDFETMNEIGEMKKKDDICDNICMMQAFKYNHFIDLI